MIKKLVLALAICLLSLGVARAEVKISEWIDKVPEIHQAVIYNVTDSQVDYASTVTVYSAFQDKVKLDIGYSPKTEALVAISYKLAETKNFTDNPILKYIVIEPGLFYGWDRISGINLNQKGNSEGSWGLICKIISVKF